MVSATMWNLFLSGVTLAQQISKAPIERLDPPTRAAVIMTIFGLVLLGLALVAAVMIGARWVRRLARERPRRRGATHETPGSEHSQRLREALASKLPQIDSGNTMQIDRGAGDTKIDP